MSPDLEQIKMKAILDHKIIERERENYFVLANYL